MDKEICLLENRGNLQEHRMANKCPKTLGNKGLSGILCFDETASATLLQLATEKVQKGIVASGCLVRIYA